MSTNKKKLARVVNTHRAKLIKLYSLNFEGSATQAIEQITTRAVERAYVSHRPPPPGEVMKAWVIESRAPQWACRATFDLLIELNWLPNTDIEKAIAARFLLLNDYPINESWKALLGEWLELAKQAQKENSDEYE
ncbi:hypothetical protein [Vibrio tapetis]|uniref:Putative transcription antitermination factor n=2 Tax=Vibrio tapetis TaxID=52443 RepID=A0A2N8ZNV2_9VIBR|nr:hypothetical protein [Vibrio tapetis]ACB99673.1 putative transcription antitermination factor [Vibrio tapetis]SON51474.1 putative transcription antitermination factor [Vibrio tapetis subsp. tapetis]SON53537.1 putative transcription antitermination factor [Vibrio tapetis subsp. tapetis]